MANNDGSLSYHLYEQLLEFVGTPNIVRTRRLFFKAMNDMLSHELMSVICSGSKAEGLDMPGSDLDVMFIHDAVVHNDISKISFIGFYLDTENTSPGFANIRIYDSVGIGDLPHSKNTEKGPILENRGFRGSTPLLESPYSKYRAFAARYLDVYFPTHGPCVSTCDEKYDFLFALQCQSWPDIASNWIVRPKEWPSTNLIEDILNGKVLLAPIGSKFGSVIDNPNEWRLSFSVAEIILVHSFNHTQLTCYAMLKLILKEVIDENPGTEKLLCSYFIKTTIFWLIEETGYSAWQPHKLIQCFRTCLKRLYYLVENGQCPNYFIPQNNMFEGKVCGNPQKELLRLLECLYSEGINTFFRSKTLSKYLQSVYESGMPGNAYTVTIKPNEVDTAVYPLLQHFFKTFALQTSALFNIYKAFCRMMYKKSSKLERALHMLYFVNMFQEECVECEYNIKNSNKQLYVQFRSCLCLLVTGTYSDAVYGWLLLASFFYRHQQYQNVHIITDFILSSCITPESHLSMCDESIPKRPINISPSSSSFLKRYRYACIKSGGFLIKENTVFDKTDLLTILPPGLPRQILIISTPAFFAQFLAFMSFHHSGHLVERKRALQRLQREFENVENTSMLSLLDMCNYVKAFEHVDCKLPMFSALPKLYAGWPKIFATYKKFFGRMPTFDSEYFSTFASEFFKRLS